MTRSTPKIASYEFTTLHPHIGKIVYDDFSEIILEDLPGIIEGAHDNKGLGHRFLKHLEKSKLIIIVLDGSNLPTYKRNPINDFKILRKEVSLFNEKLLQKPYLVVLNKKDINSEVFNQNKILLLNELAKEELQPLKIVEISGKTGDNIEELVNSIKKGISQV